MTEAINKKKIIATIALLIGIFTILLPILIGFGGYLPLLILGHPLLPIPWGLYLEKGLYCVVSFLGIFFVILGLALKPWWNKQVAKLIIALACTIFSLCYFGTIIIMNQ